MYRIVLLSLLLVLLIFFLIFIFILIFLCITRPSKIDETLVFRNDVGQLAQVEVSAGEDADDGLADELLSQAKCRRRRGSPSSFGEVVCDAEQQSHGFPEFGFAD